TPTERSRLTSGGNRPRDSRRATQRHAPVRRGPAVQPGTAPPPATARTEAVDLLKDERKQTHSSSAIRCPQVQIKSQRCGQVVTHGHGRGHPPAPVDASNPPTSPRIATDQVSYTCRS